MALPVESLTPREIVARLDEYIVGQTAAKKAVAVALRNRFRRMNLSEADRADVLPKNILMVGPTGVGKTEIARRLAGLARAPFVKVEATKFTEVGYVGRDVDSIIRDLTADAVRIVQAEKAVETREEAARRAVDRIVELLDDTPGFGFVGYSYDENGEIVIPEETEPEVDESKREELRRAILAGEKDDELVEITSEEANMPFVQMFSNQGIEEMGIESAHPAFGTKFVQRRLTVKEAKDALAEQEAEKMVDKASIFREAVARAEESGIVFIDEIDKVAIKSGGGSGPDVSREGVQRDLLPVIEGSTVQTKYGPVRTEHILFICAGAFHLAKVSDLIPELQGRLPIRVELEPLALNDLRRILREPKNALTGQYKKLLAVDGVNVTFTEDALDEIASIATAVNERSENIGARRLHTIMERLLEELLFEAPEGISGDVTFDAARVKSVLDPISTHGAKSRDLL